MKSSGGTEAIERQLWEHHQMFLAFARKRVGDPDLAADAVQDAFLKAIKAAGQIREGENLLPWFYRILRRTIIDLHRRRGVRSRVIKEMPDDFDAPAMTEERADVCRCLKAILPTLKPEYAAVIEAIDLGEGDLEKVSAELGVQRGNLKVRLHRARQQLKSRLIETCQLCATHGCLDCACSPAPPASR